MMPCCPFVARFVRLLALACLLGILGLACLRPVPKPPVAPLAVDKPAGPTDGGPNDRPRLAVLLLFDQLRADYLTRWEDLFVADGFRRLVHQGAWFQNCHYPYAVTTTGPGHASVLTGCSPDTHGIIDNDWYDRGEAASIYCAALTRYERVPPLETKSKPGDKKLRAGAPDRLLAPTLGDALETASGGQGRVVALSLKDRSSVLPAGKKPTACYWFDSTSGDFVTSNYYRDRVHPWIEQFNSRRPAEHWFGKDWLRLRPDLDYGARSGPDDVEGEGKGSAQGRTFPHSMTGGLKKPGKEYYEALYNSPFGNELLLELVKTAVVSEQLGKDEQPDLLSISCSSNDPVGHCWGPDSQEVLDVTLRTDLLIRELLNFLDAQVGRNRYVLVLTADHGVCPLPEVARSQGKEPIRIDPGKLTKDAARFLDSTFGADPDKAPWFEQVTEWFYLNLKALKKRGLEPDVVAERLAGWLATQPGLAAAYTRSQLQRSLPADDLLGQRVRKSFYPERCGEVTMITQPYCFVTTYLTGTSHGTPHPYDTHVPLVVFGHGVRPGVRQDSVTPQAAAAALARGIWIDPPARAEASLPDGLFESLPVSR